MPTERCQPAHIPQPPHFVKQLAPYIRTRQEALRIRQALTLYLRSHIVYADDATSSSCHAQSHLSLCVYNDSVANLKRIPPDIIGLRRDYLLALQENLAAKKEYNAVAERVTTRVSGSDKSPSGAESIELVNHGLRTYLQLLRDRRQHAKGQVFEHYLGQLQTREVSRAGCFEPETNRGRQDLFSDEIEDTHQGNGDKSRDVDTLISSLERAMILAKSQLDREMKLFEELKARLERSGIPAVIDLPPSVQIAALQRARDELVRWVENKLASVDTSDDTAVDTMESGGLEDPAQLLEDGKARISKQYAAYVAARKELLESIPGACQSITIPPRKQQIRRSLNAADNTTEVLKTDALNVLQYASEVLLPLSKNQKALALQKSYVTSMLAKEKSTMLRMLGRLRDESHLIPEYPILVRQHRFQHALAALGVQPKLNVPKDNQDDGLISLAEAWAFASDAARSHDQEYVEKRLSEGEEIAEQTQHTLEDVYGILNQNLAEATLDGTHSDSDNDGPDIWTSCVLEQNKSAGEKNKRSRGPWIRLNGRLGVAGDE